MSTIGERIQAAREAMGLSRADLARRAGLPEATISRVETGKRENPNSETIRAIAEALGTSSDLLLGLADRSPAAAQAALIALGVDAATLAALQAVAGGLEADDWWMLVERARRRLARRAQEERTRQERQQGRGHAPIHEGHSVSPNEPPPGPPEPRYGLMTGGC